MKQKCDTIVNDNKNEAAAYIKYIKLNKSISMFRSWAKYKEILINNPCAEQSHPIYFIAKSMNRNNPLPLMMPDVHFPEDYCSSQEESWEEIYFNDDLFIALENKYNNRLCAFSLETLFLTNKYNGFLRTELRFDDKNLMKMGKTDQVRFLTQLKMRYPEYYSEYLAAQSSESVFLSKINKDKINHLLNTVEIMLVLTFHKEGLHSTSLPDSLPDLLSAYGYQLLIQAISEHLNDDEKEGLNYLWATNIHDQSQKTVPDLINSALGGECTTKLGLYWLGLIKEFRQGFSFALDERVFINVYENYVNNNPVASIKISKSFFMHYILDNMMHIATELNPINEHHNRQRGL